MTRLYKSNYKTSRGVRRFHVDFTTPPANPLTDTQKLLANIEHEKQFIEKYPNYPTLCDEARVRLKFYERRLAELRKDNYGMSFKNRLVPGKTCPHCGTTLTVNETVNENEYPKIKRRLVCPNWFINGCEYKEAWTDEIEALLEKADLELASQPAEF